MISKKEIDDILSKCEYDKEIFKAWGGPDKYKDKEGNIFYVYEASLKEPYYSEEPVIIDISTGEYRFTNHLELIDNYTFVG